MNLSGQASIIWVNQLLTMRPGRREVRILESVIWRDYQKIAFIYIVVGGIQKKKNYTFEEKNMSKKNKDAFNLDNFISTIHKDETKNDAL